MTEVGIDGPGRTLADGVHVGLLPALEGPEWHGHNLDALWHGIAGGPINDSETAFRNTVGARRMILGR